MVLDLKRKSKQLLYMTIVEEDTIKKEKEEI